MPIPTPFLPTLVLGSLNSNHVSRTGLLVASRGDPSHPNCVVSSRDAGNSRSCARRRADEQARRGMMIVDEFSGRKREREREGQINWSPILSELVSYSPPLYQRLQG